MLLDAIYHTIPEKIHKEYIDTLELHSFVKNHSHSENYILNSPDSELVGYPIKSEFVDESPLFSRVIDATESKTSPRIRFEPTLLDFGIL